MDTVLLENDSYYRAGQKEWCESFDPNFLKVSSDTKRDWSYRDNLRLACLLSQPNVLNICADSGFESGSSFFFMKLHSHQDEHYQLQEFAEVLLEVVRTREKLGHPPLTVHLNYLGVDFLDSLVREKWGDECYQEIELIVRQNPESLFVKIYTDFSYRYTLTEEMIENARSKFENGNL